MTTPSESRTCSCCKELKPLSEFYKKPTSPCKVCKREINRRYKLKMLEDKSTHFKYRLAQSEWRKRHVKKMKGLGIDVYVSMDERLKAIMQLS